MKRAIIIGATSGIGKELSKLLADENFKVGITGRRKEKLDSLHQSAPERFIVKAFDCTTENNTKHLEDLTRELGGIDLLIMSSGTGDLNEELDYDIEKRTNHLNVVAFTEIMDWSYKHFESQGHGHLVAITSIGGIRGGRIAPAYNASKAYQINYLEGLRQKARNSKKPIYITDIRPGLVDTDMAKGEGLFWVAPKLKAASQILKLIKKKRPVGYVTKRWKIVALSLKIMPRWIYDGM